MKRGIFFLIVFSIGCLGLAQSKQELLPYKGGEAALKNELKNFIGSQIRSNDSAGVYYVEVGKINDKAVDFEITGSGKNDSLTVILNNFFKGSLNNWETERFEGLSVIIPLYIWSVCHLDKNGYVDWSRLSKSKLPGTKKAIFVSPLVVMYICGGVNAD